MISGHVLVIALQLAVIGTLLVDSAPACYISGMLWYLVHAAQQFSRMLFIQPD